MIRSITTQETVVSDITGDKISADIDNVVCDNIDIIIYGVVFKFFFYAFGCNGYEPINSSLTSGDTVVMNNECCLLSDNPKFIPTQVCATNFVVIIVNFVQNIHVLLIIHISEFVLGIGFGL